MHSSVIGKIEKANRYARELDRITIDRLSLTFRGDNDTHVVTLDADRWQVEQRIRHAENMLAATGRS